MTAPGGSVNASGVSSCCSPVTGEVTGSALFYVKYSLCNWQRLSPHAVLSIGWTPPTFFE